MRASPVPRRHTAAALLTASLALTLAACSSGASPSSTKGTSGAATAGATHGEANIAYAGSLEQLENSVLGPQFARQTGDSFTGPPGAGSLALAEGILAGEYSPGVFLSVGAKAIKMLWPSHRSAFALALATDPLVVAYSESSPDAAELNAIASGKKPLRDLFSLMATPGFKLGRTDPNEDPQGQFFELMVNLAQRVLGLPPGTAARILGTSRTSPTGNSSQIYSETALSTVIANGSVDAGSAFLPEALQYHLRYILLPPTLDFSTPSESSLYASVSVPLSDGTTVTGGLITLYATLVNPSGGTQVSAADRAADDAYVAFLLSARGRSDLASNGYSLESPKLEVPTVGTSAGSVLPADVLSAYRHLGGSVVAP